MPSDLQNRLDSLRQKAEIVTNRYLKVVEEKRNVDALVKAQGETIERLEREISVLKQRIEHLTVVTTIAPRREDVERSREILSELVRDIDKCISELSE